MCWNPIFNIEIGCQGLEKFQKSVKGQVLDILFVNLLQNFNDNGFTFFEVFLFADTVKVYKSQVLILFLEKITFVHFAGTVAVENLFEKRGVFLED